MKEQRINDLLKKAAESNNGIVRSHQGIANGDTTNAKLEKNNLMALPERLTLFEVASPDPARWYDVFQITDFGRVPGNRFHVGAVLALKEAGQSLRLEAAIYDKAKDEKIMELPVIEDHDTAMITLNQTEIMPSGISESDLVLAVQATYRNASGEERSLLKPMEWSLNVNDYIEYVHIRPVKENGCVPIGAASSYYYSGAYVGEVSDRVVISYLRTPDDVRDCDYVCNFKRGEGTDHPIIGIPFHCKLKLKKRGKFLEPVTGQGWICRMDSTASGGKICTYEDKKEHTYGNAGDELIEIEEAGSWGVVYEEEGGMKPVDFHFYYDMYLHISVEDEKQGLELTWNTMVTSSQAEGALYHEILPLRLMWGCVEKNAMVLLADGSMRSVENLKIGDRVRGIEGEDAIINIWKGREEKLTELLLEDFCRLKLTNDHPVLTDVGYRKAAQLKAGDLVVMADGGKIPVKAVCEAVYGDMVYNLELESGRNFFANGIAVGDYRCQNGMR
ncbi:MAG: Hint domain-containing protein [Clostridiales bacterium]|nr:Hint domain-containing protein [Clostridiales bacterium]